MNTGQKIGDWSPEKLAKFIQERMLIDRPALPKSLTGETITVHGTLIVRDRIVLSPQALRYIKDNLPP